MSETSTGRDRSRAIELTGDATGDVSPEQFAASFGEDLRRLLDVDTWLPGEDLHNLYGRLADEVLDATRHEAAALRQIRQEVLPRLSGYPGAPSGAGHYRAKLSDLERIHRGLLFNGGVEACDGRPQVHDTLPLTIYQVGVCLVSYQGDQGTWGNRLFRRDLRMASGDPMAEMIDLLERREPRGGMNQPSRHDRLSELAQRGIMSYAERAILLRRSNAIWRMGHGSPAPYELITGSGSLDLMIEATKVIRELVEGHQKFVFVASQPVDRVLLTIGQALHPLEFAIVSTLKEQINATVDNGHYRMRVASDTTWDGRRLNPEEWIRTFRDVVAPRVVVGVYRATRLAPAQVFYAHADHADVAACIALADSVLQEQRGFPLLIDLAQTVCSGVFGRETLASPVSVAYADAGAPWQYLSERASRFGR
ncbi:MAG TPA: hypothetical protein VNL16_10850 [Chloroflexota bacterium]|nr:hypothetical protein [Chloroflexota bacterium]